MDKKTIRIARYWTTQMPNLEVNPSFQMFHKETGSQALKTDERITRHWISSITRLFFRKNCDYVVYTEEDHIIGKNFETSLEAILPLFSECQTCWTVNMGCHGDCWGLRSNYVSDVVRMESGNMGVVYSKPKFTTFLTHLEIYCDMLGDWDHNVHKMAAMGYIPSHSLTYLSPRIHHLSTCFSSRTRVVKKRNCSWEKEIKAFNRETKKSSYNLVDKGIANYVKAHKTYSKADTITKNRCIKAGKFYES